MMVSPHAATSGLVPMTIRAKDRGWSPEMTRINLASRPLFRHYTRNMCDISPVGDGRRTAARAQQLRTPRPTTACPVTGVTRVTGQAGRSLPPNHPQNQPVLRLQPGRAWNLRRRSSPWRSRPPRPLGASELFSMSPRYSSVPLRCHLRAGGNCRAGIDRDFLGFLGISSEANP